MKVVDRGSRSILEGLVAPRHYPSIASLVYEKSTIHICRVNLHTYLLINQIIRV